MRRKMIKQDVFDRLVENSALNAEAELIESEALLSRAVGKDLRLHSFSSDSAIFRTDENTYLHCGFLRKDGKLVFENLEELVLDEQSRREKRLSQLEEMIDHVISDELEPAAKLFEQCFRSVTLQEALRVSGRELNESENKTSYRKKRKAELPKKTRRMRPDEVKNENLRQVFTIANQVLEAVDFYKYGNVEDDTEVTFDENENVKTVSIDDCQQRCKKQLLGFDWKTVNSEFRVLRNGAKDLKEDVDFVSAVSDLKTHNAVSAVEKVEESLDAISMQWPNALFLKESELARLVKECLELSGENNYDDQTCNFLAEAILQRLYEDHPDTTAKILRAAKAPLAENDVDPYEHFVVAASQFYDSIDENTRLEKSALQDLHRATSMIHDLAEHHGDRIVKKQTALVLNDLVDAINENGVHDVETAEAAANYLTRFVEAAETGNPKTWEVLYTPYKSLNGSHPITKKYATENPNPADYTSLHSDMPLQLRGGDKNDFLRRKDMSDKEHLGWGLAGGEEVFSQNKNPYLPKGANMTMSHNQGVGQNMDKAVSTFKSADTWPNLRNDGLKPVDPSIYQVPDGGPNLKVEKK